MNQRTSETVSQMEPNKWARWTGRLMLGLGLVMSTGLMIGCRCSAEKEPITDAGPLKPVVLDELHEAGAVTKTLSNMLPNCEIDHRGAFLELASKATEGRFGFGLLAPSSFHEHVLEGSSWARVDGKSLRVAYYQSWRGPVFVQLRIHGVGSRAVVVRVDRKRLGTLRLTPDKIEVLNTRESEDVFEPGVHELLLQFYRTKRKSEAKADIDWIRVGRPDHVRGAYTPPLLRDVIQDKLIGGRAMRTVAMRPRSRITCTVGVTKKMRLKGTIGFEGPGEVQARVYLSLPGQPAALLQSSKLGDEDNRPVPLDMDLGSYAGRIVHLTFEVGKGAKEAKVYWGGIELQTDPEPLATRHKARALLLVVLSGVARRHLPPYTERPDLPTLTKLAAESATFTDHRAVTSTTTGQMAALLTGFSPHAIRVSDPGARLAKRFPSFAKLATSARVQTAMFTSAPTTSEAFGFDIGWNRYEYFSPISGTSAYATLVHATKWVEKKNEESPHQPLLLLLHARGAHPPWILRKGQADKLPPEEYTGVLTGRKAGEFFAQRRTWRRSRRHITAHDFVRAEGYVQAVLHNADAELLHLIDALKARKVWQDTMVIVTSDVAMGNADHVPFDDGVRLDEDLLKLPLLIRFPGGRYAGATVRAPTDTLDLAPTILKELGLKIPKEWTGRDLYKVAAYPNRYVATARLATLKRQYTMNMGKYTLLGRHARRPKLCVLGPEDQCQQDLSEQLPILAAFLWRSTYRRFRNDEQLFNPRASRHPATTTNPEVISALTVWGNMEAQ